MRLNSDIARHALGLRQTGFALVTGIFILVVLAGLGAAMVSISTTQHTTVAMDIQSARAQQAARAGIEWGAYKVLVVANACPASPAAFTFPGTPLAGFNTTVTCVATGHSEGQNTVTLYRFISTATYGAVNTTDYVARQISAQIARCVDPGGVAC